MARRVLVDDTSPLIRYADGSAWFVDDTGIQDAQGNYGPIYNKTLHGTISSTSFSFNYEGTGISVFGTNNIRNDSGTIDPQWVCSVDGNKLQSNPFNFAENNWNLCSTGPDPKDGPHTLTVNVTIKRSQTFWLDRIDYTPSSSVPLEDKTMLVQNNDPELQYGPGWAPFGGGANVTSQTGSKLTFQFTGISLSWFGFTPTERPHGATTGTYAIDDQTPMSFVLKGLPEGNVPTLYNQEYFRTPDLPPGPHKLDVVFLGNDKTTSLVLDYLVVRNASAAADHTSLPGDVNAKGSKSHIGTIVGCVLGGIAAFLIGFLAFYAYRRVKRARKGGPENGDGLDNEDNGGERESPQPAVSPYSTDTPSSFTGPRVSLNNASQFLPSSKLVQYQQQARHSQISPGTSEGRHSSVPSSSLRSPPTLSPSSNYPSTYDGRPESDIVVAEDSGLRNVMPLQPPKIEVPPTYTPT